MKTVADKLRLALGWTAALTLLCAGPGCTWIQHRRADIHVDRGQRLLAEDDLEVALLEFQEAAELHPQLAVAHSNMGVIYQRMGEYERAIECFANSIRYNPFSFSDSLNLARLYHFSKRLHDAVEVYLHACDLRPDDFDAQLNLGVCYQQMGEIQQAVERFHNAIEIDPDRPYAFVNLGVAYDTQGKHYEAIHAYKDALERDNHQPLVLVNLAHTYMKQDRLKISRATLETALRLDGQLAPAHEALGYCLFRMQDYEQAERAYKNAALSDPKLPNTFAGLGSIYALHYVQDKARTDLRDRALEYWHRSLELDPDQPRIQKLVAKYRPRNSDPETVLLADRPPD